MQISVTKKSWIASVDFKIALNHFWRIILYNFCEKKHNAKKSIQLKGQKKPKKTLILYSKCKQKITAFLHNVTKYGVNRKEQRIRKASWAKTIFIRRYVERVVESYGLTKKKNFFDASSKWYKKTCLLHDLRSWKNQPPLVFYILYNKSDINIYKSL